MKQELTSALGRTYLSIEIDHANHWVATNWEGYLTAESIKAGAKAYTQALATAGYSCVLNDTRAVRGPWDHSLDWVLNEWAPAAAAAGLRHFAMITTPESMADESALAFNARITAFEVRMFADIAEAQRWLRRQVITVLKTA